MTGNQFLEVWELLQLLFRDFNVIIPSQKRTERCLSIFNTKLLQH
jgi:hypothetical protein